MGSSRWIVQPPFHIPQDYRRMVSGTVGRQVMQRRFLMKGGYHRVLPIDHN